MYIALCDALSMPSDVPIADVVMSIRNRDVAHAERAKEIDRLTKEIDKVRTQLNFLIALINRKGR